MAELFFSVDIESDGPIPGMYSMLSFGCAAYTADGKLVGTYSANLETLPGAKQAKDTMEWWKTQPEAWEAHRKNTRPAEKVMPEFVQWVMKTCTEYNNTLSPGHGGAKPVFVGYPAGFDFTFFYWYLIAFAGASPFSFAALDIKSFAMAVLKCEFRDVSKRRMPKHWFGKGRHNHIALDDALEQGELFCNILKESRSK